MAITGNRAPAPSVRTTLFIDAGFEFAVGAALIAFAGTIGGWFGFGPPIAVAIGLVFVLAGVVILQMARSPVDSALVRALASANIAGGALGWLTLAVVWGSLAPEARWLLGMASDAVILIGLLELLALRRAA